MEKILDRLRNKKGATMADAWIDDIFVAADDDDLSSWEIINQSDDDDENEDYSFDEDDVYVLESLSSDLSTQSLPPDLVDHITDHDVRVPEDVMMKHVSIDQEYGYNDHHDDDDDDDEEEEEDDNDDYDLDDELVPKSVSDRFGRQRLRKLGKRAYTKMIKSKRLPYYYNRPGCVYGKHGLGLLNIIV